jgi:AcrR family transcriptional regulator
MTDGLDQAQADLLLAVLGFVAGLRADPLLTLTDDDVADGAAAVSATLETAERGLIYEHRPQSLPAQRFVNDIKGFLAGLAAGADASAARRLEQNAAVVLRRLEQGLRGARAAGDQGPAAGLGIIGRFMAAARAAGLAAGREGKPIIETPSSLLVKP